MTASRNHNRWEERESERKEFSERIDTREEGKTKSSNPKSWVIGGAGAGAIKKKKEKNGVLQMRMRRSWRSRSGSEKGVVETP